MERSSEQQLDGGLGQVIRSMEVDQFTKQSSSPSSAGFTPRIKKPSLPPSEASISDATVTAKPTTTASLPNRCLHIFYYMWYANEEHDGGYSHWNHKYLPHWNPSRAKNYPTGQHVPPNDIGANFYPKQGCYSSASETVMEVHMRQLRDAKVGVAVVSWYPSHQSDQSGAIPPDQLIPQLLNAALKHDIKIAIHIEPYKDRTPLSVRDDIKYIHRNYANHPALFKMAPTKLKSNSSNPLPVIYVYDSYLSPAKEWAGVLSVSGSHTIRNTLIDSIVIGLVVKMVHTNDIKLGGFDGFFTYFASDGFTYASSSRNWAYLASFAKQSNLIFIPSAGPGYEDTRVRPWNAVNSRMRKNGEYYKTMMSKAIVSSSSIVSITSFNEWHEGTQIEPAIPMITGSFKYRDYEPFSPDYYLNLTAEISKTIHCTV